MAVSRIPWRKRFGHLAKVGVEGSNPFARSRSWTKGSDGVHGWRVLGWRAPARLSLWRRELLLNIIAYIVTGGIALG
jgi:hypothetical protein